MARTSALISVSGMVSMKGMASSSCALARLQPLRQQRVRVDGDFAVVAGRAILEPALQRTVAPGVEEIGATADVLTVDEDLRHGLLAGAIREHGADTPAEVVLLEFHRIDI